MWLENQGETGAARFAVACTRYKDIPIDSERQERGVEVRPLSEGQKREGEEEGEGKGKEGGLLVSHSSITPSQIYDRWFNAKSKRPSNFSIRETITHLGRKGSLTGRGSAKVASEITSSAEEMPPEIWSLTIGENDLKRRTPEIGDPKQLERLYETFCQKYEDQPPLPLTVPIDLSAYP